MNIHGQMKNIHEQIMNIHEQIMNIHAQIVNIHGQISNNNNNNDYQNQNEICKTLMSKLTDYGRSSDYHWLELVVLVLLVNIDLFHFKVNYCRQKLSGVISSKTLHNLLIHFFLKSLHKRLIVILRKEGVVSREYCTPSKLLPFLISQIHQSWPPPPATTLISVFTRDSPHCLQLFRIVHQQFLPDSEVLYVEV